MRIEIFIPDLPDSVYGSVLEELGNELTYAYGGFSILPATGKFRTSDGVILPDAVNLLFCDTPFFWDRDRLVVEYHARRIKRAVSNALALEESVLVVVYPVFHAE